MNKKWIKPVSIGFLIVLLFVPTAMAYQIGGNEPEISGQIEKQPFEEFSNKLSTTNSRYQSDEYIQYLHDQGYEVTVTVHLRRMEITSK